MNGKKQAGKYLLTILLTKYDLLHFLVKFTPMLALRLFFGLINLLVAFFLLKNLSLVTFAPLLFTNLRVVAARLLTMAKTARHFIVHCREHLGINRKGNSVKGASSAIRDHIKDTGHSASLDDFCIIDKTNNELHLLIREGLLILRDHPTLNFRAPQFPFAYFSSLRPLVTYFLLI